MSSERELWRCKRELVKKRRLLWKVTYSFYYLSRAEDIYGFFDNYIVILTHSTCPKEEKV